MACPATGGPYWWSQSMYVGMSLRKNEHGVFVVRIPVPKHLQEAVALVLENGKERRAICRRPQALRTRLKPSELQWAC